MTWLTQGNLDVLEICKLLHCITLLYFERFEIRMSHHSVFIDGLIMDSESAPALLIGL